MEDILNLFPNTILLDREQNDQQSTNNENGNIRVKTIKITPGDLALMLLSLVLFCVTAIDTGILSIIALILSPPLYAIFSHRIGNHFSFFVPLVAFIISFIATGSGVAAVSVILSAGMSFSIIRAVNVSPERAKSSAVVGCAISGVIYVFAYLMALKLQFGISPTDMVNDFNLALDEYKASFLAQAKSLDLESLGYQSMSIKDFSEMLDIILHQLRVSLPSVVILAFMIVGYISASLTVFLSKLLKSEKMFWGVDFRILPTTATVYIYFICSLISIFSSGSFAYGLENMINLISPALLVCGLKQIGEYFEMRNVPKLGVNIIIVVAAVLSFTLLGGIGSSLLTIFGMFYCFRHNSKIQQ